MTATVIVENDTAVATNTFAVGGTATDPDAVTVALTDPNGDTTTYTYGTDGELTKSSTGVYVLTVAVPTDGVWQYVFVGTGAAADVQPGSFRVYPTSRLYASLADLHGWVDMPDSLDDAELRLSLESASRWVDSYCDRHFYRTAPEARYFTPVNGTLWVDDLATLDGLIVASDTGNDGLYATTWTTSDYHPVAPESAAEPRPWTRLATVGTLSWPCHTYRPPVQVTGEWGWPSVPAAVSQATLIMAARLHLRRDSPTGVLGGFDAFGPVRVGTRLDPDVESILAPFRKYPVMVA